MKIEMLIDKLQEVVDGAFTLPLSGGKTVVDTEELKKIIEDMRNNLPQEIRQAKSIADDRTNIINKSKEDAEKVVQQAEERAKLMVSQSEIVRLARQEADEIIFNANKKAGEIQRAADSYIDSLMSQTDKLLSENLSDLKTKHQAIKSLQQKKGVKTSRTSVKNQKVSDKDSETSGNASNSETK